jgi:hypothetical protein
MTTIIFDLDNRVCDNCAPTSAVRCSFVALQCCKLRAANVRQ